MTLWLKIDPVEEMLVSVGTAENPVIVMAKRNDVSVKIDVGVVTLAKMVAAGRQQTLAEYLSEVLSPIVRQHLDQEYAKHSPKPPKPKR